MNVIIIGKGNLGKAFLEYSQSHFDFVIEDIIDESSQIKEYEKVDAIIDFSAPEAILISIHLALKYDVPLIIGTTSYNKDQLELIKDYASDLRICKDANFSIGFHILKTLKTMIDKIDVSHDEYIIETHQKYKKDKPSGSSKVLTQKEDEIISLRGGTVNGEHEIRVFFDNEELSLKHSIHSRQAFVDGVIKVIPYLTKAKNGLYSFDSFRKEIYGF